MAHEDVSSPADGDSSRSEAVPSGKAMPPSFEPTGTHMVPTPTVPPSQSTRAAQRSHKPGPMPRRRQQRLARKVQLAIDALGAQTVHRPLKGRTPGLPKDMVALFRELGIALLRSGQSVTEVEETLLALGARYDIPVMRTFILPTGVIVRVESPDGAITDFASSQGEQLKLHQIADVYKLVNKLMDDEVNPTQARQELAQIMSSKPRFGSLGVIFGHGLLSVGFGLVLGTSAAVLPVLAGLGIMVGLLRAVAAKWPTLNTALPVIASLLVTVIALNVSEHLALGTSPLRILAPPLIAFLPGALLTVAAMELTNNEVVAGASRIVYGGAQLLLLSFGVAAGFALVGPTTALAPGNPLQGWPQWAGIAVVAIGYVFYASPPKWTLPWMMLALYLTYTTQVIGAGSFGPLFAGFGGGLIVAPLAMFLGRMPHGPPYMVTLLPSFWMLVPGALSFVGLSTIATGDPLGTEDLTQAIMTLFAIALGVLLGSGLARDLRRITRSLAGQDMSEPIPPIVVSTTAATQSTQTPPPPADSAP